MGTLRGLPWPRGSRWAGSRRPWQRWSTPRRGCSYLGPGGVVEQGVDGLGSGEVLHDVAVRELGLLHRHVLPAATSAQHLAHHDTRRAWQQRGFAVQWYGYVAGLFLFSNLVFYLIFEANYDKCRAAPTCSATMVLRGLPDPLNLVLHQVDSDLNLVFNELVPNSAYSEK